MSAEYFILKTLVKNGGSMSLAAFLNETMSKQSKYDSRYIRKNMRIMLRNCLISESSQIVSLTDSGYSRHSVLRAKQKADIKCQIVEWIRWAITTGITVIKLLHPIN